MFGGTAPAPAPDEPVLQELTGSAALKGLKVMGGDREGDKATEGTKKTGARGSGGSASQLLGTHPSAGTSGHTSMLPMKIGAWMDGLQGDS